MTPTPVDDGPLRLWLMHVTVGVALSPRELANLRLALKMSHMKPLDTQKEIPCPKLMN
jgi:hypothetical protein